LALSNPIWPAATMKNVILALSVLFFTVHTACVRSPFSRPVKYVAYVGFNYLNAAKDSANNYLDSLYIVALETYLQRINAQKDPKPYPYEFRLKTFQCDYKPDTIPLLYANIVKDTNITLVIDNTWGRYIRLAAPIIRDQLPVMSMSADQNRLNFGKNALFLQPNDPQPNYFVQFIDKVLKKKVGRICDRVRLFAAQSFCGKSAKQSFSIRFGVFVATQLHPEPGSTQGFGGRDGA
jgi:hypothetical protein